ncbi:hypothetical protein DVA67_019030 [Solirubrobacter sp. CPCC 204708]|uniref:Uncharacterized protein n=1 Tax=Solirubrobacter deserti TaxID=2282478 RepID=A0ABT4RG57_9ACTN|nr:hypothetical protein [Solirubrobacter deserti]MBE2318083.1 hypothetical protein [Solirubrobacter deserti]MDA0137361.1 hypothetical protein [Solirubrobacter deserti]
MQPWPGEVLEERAGEIAVAFAALLTRQAGWRHRRVETIAVLSHEEVRRSVSVDFTVPFEHRDELRLSDGEWVVPLAVLDKRKLVHFDLFGEDGYALPLVRSDEVRLIARELLYLMLDIELEDAEPGFDASDLIERVLAAGPEDVEAVTARVDAVAGQAPEFAALARVLTSKFLLCAVLDTVAKRRIVKFAYDEPLGRPDRRSHFYGTQGCTEAASYHVELSVPEGMRARSADIVDNRTGELLLEGPRDSDRPGLHYMASTGAEIEPGLRVKYAPERSGFLVPAMLVAWVLTLELGLAWAFADLHGIARSGGPAVAVLLSVSAVFSSLVLRAGEHPLVQLVLARYRMLLGTATLAAVAAGGTLAFRGSETLLSWTWGVGALVALATAGILSIEVVRAPATAKRP